MFVHQTATMQARSVRVVHVCEVSARGSAANAYRKRRSGSPCHRRLREVPSGCVPGHGVRVQRRARVLTGRRSFVSIHTRSVVARDPRPDLYRGVRDASQTLILTVRIRTGKGLTIAFSSIFRVFDVHLALCMTAPSTTPGPTPCRDGDVWWRRMGLGSILKSPSTTPFAE